MNQEVSYFELVSLFVALNAAVAPELVAAGMGS
jgi:hypothetical protein